MKIAMVSHKVRYIADNFNLKQLRKFEDVRF